MPSTPPRQSIEVAAYQLPGERDLRKKAMIAGGVALLLVASFMAGMLINGDGARKGAPETLDDQQKHVTASARRAAETPLVPAGVGGLSQPITSAPAATPADGNMPDEYQRTDATAVSAAEYAQMEKRAHAASVRQKSAPLVDPRSITGNSWEAAAVPRRARTRPAPASQLRDASTPAPRTQDAAPALVRTSPVPKYQPVPPISASGTARLTLLVGADGNVKQVGIDRAPAGGNTAALLAAVHSWRFKPATENGDPVAAPYSVEISFERD